METPFPIIEVAIEPKTARDRESLGRALASLAAEDPSFGVEVDHDCGQTIIKVMSELHLTAVLDRMKREFKVEPNVGALQVAYRETITQPSEITYAYKKQYGPKGEFAQVKMRFEPLPVGTGFEFVNEADDRNVPEEYIPGVEKGILGAMRTGVLAGFPVIDFRAVLYDGQYHDIDSSPFAFENATRAAFREGVIKARPTLLEPIMRVEVTMPDELRSTVIDDLKRRRGVLIEAETSDQRVTATVPLANMFGYAATLNAITDGAGSWSMRFATYAPLPQAAPDDPKFPGAAAARVA
ncbi:MAG: hypothetical protein JO255_11330 [Alphaproteobacteria bacterium]|nr:hypothetical protein [Alphaproteobacteria bacterium]